MLRLVCIGGGTGLPVLLSGLKNLADAAGQQPTFAVTALVTVADSGGSSGILRDLYRMPAVGDIRNCLVALSANNSALAEVSQYRFSGGDGLEGHALGNLLLTALYHRTGALGSAVELAREIFQSRGNVLPVSEDEMHMCAEYDDGSVVTSQSKMCLAGRKIRSVWLDPPDIAAHPAALQAIASADAVILSPGSLYSSVIAALLVPGVVEAINSSDAVTLYVCNLMTQPGETDGFTAADHVRTLRQYIAPRAVDLVIANSRPLQIQQRQRYSALGSHSVAVDEREIAMLGSIPICADVMSRQASSVRHDPAKLARLVHGITLGALRARDILRPPSRGSEW
jgi:uncharacterized cofD-like protein